MEFDESNKYFKKVNLKYESNGNIILELRSVDSENQESNARIFNLDNVSVKKPSKTDIDTFESICNIFMIPPLDMENPGKKNFIISIDEKDTVLWPFYWCAIDNDSLNNNLQDLSVSFFINEERIPESYIFSYSRIIPGWVCRYWTVLLSEWRREEVIQLDIKYQFRKSVFDGKNTYPAGDYIFSLTTSVK